MGSWSPVSFEDILLSMMAPSDGSEFVRKLGGVLFDFLHFALFI